MIRTLIIVGIAWCIALALTVLRRRREPSETIDRSMWVFVALWFGASMLLDCLLPNPP